MHIYYQSVGKILNDQFARNLELVTEDGSYNYVAYLMSDMNSISVKVGRYAGSDRIDLEENNEYGFESLVKSAKQVLNKLNLENRTLTRITPKEREEKRLWNPIALREAVINAFVHNDYTKEVASKFEIFNDRLEITSSGSLPEGLSQEEFFEGFSVPRNKELMRIFKDLDLVEQLGSGVPRIRQAYSRHCFQFSENFLRVTLPSSEKVTLQVTLQVMELLKVIKHQHSRQELQDLLRLSDRENFRINYLQPAIHAGYVALSQPDKPTSKNQRYYLTREGEEARAYYEVIKI